MKTSSASLRIALLVSFVLSAMQASPQGKFELSGGAGVPELINLSLKYGQKTQVGVYGGIFPFTYIGGTKFVDWSCGIEIFHHFAGQAKYTEQQPFFVKGALMVHDLGVMNNYEEYDASFCPGIGWTINFSKKWGVNLEFGLFLPLSGVPDNYEPFEFRVLPSWSVRLFSRL